MIPLLHKKWNNKKCYKDRNEKKKEKRNTYWTTATESATSTCGCALRSEGAPCVAHRVWAIPTFEGISRFWHCDSSDATLPCREIMCDYRVMERNPNQDDETFFLMIRILLFEFEPSTINPTPALSCPRYSNRFKPRSRIGKASWKPLHAR